MQLELIILFGNANKEELLNYYQHCKHALDFAGQLTGLNLIYCTFGTYWYMQFTVQLIITMDTFTLQ